MRENLLRGGEYVPDGFGGFVHLEGDERLLARALFKLQCRRGSFPFLPRLGSRLYELGRQRPGARDAAARLWAQEALAGMGLTVASAAVTMLDSRQAAVRLTLEKDGRTMEAEVTV